MTELAILAAIVAALADMWITARNLKTGTEHNPAVRWLIERIGVWPAGAVFKAATAAAAVGLSLWAAGTPAYGLWGHAAASLAGFAVSYRNRAR